MRYFFGFLVSIGLIVLVVILVIRGFSGSPEKQVQMPLSDYANTSAEVRFTVGGPIVSDKEYQAYQIDVGRDQVHIQTMQGYQNSIIEERSYENNHEAYVNFLRALDFAGFDKGEKDSKDNDERGTCPDGNRFIMETTDGLSEKQRFWATDCRGQGNFGGDADAVKQLFESQVPRTDFSRMVNKLKI